MSSFEGSDQTAARRLPSLMQRGIDLLDLALTSQREAVVMRSLNNRAFDARRSGVECCKSQVHDAAPRFPDDRSGMCLEECLAVIITSGAREAVRASLPPARVAKMSCTPIPRAMPAKSAPAKHASRPVDRLCHPAITGIRHILQIANKSYLQTRHQEEKYSSKSANFHQTQEYLW